MTTKEAFKQLTDQRGWYHQCDINESTARSFKALFKTGNLTLDKQFELLEAAGYKVKVNWKAG